MSLAVVNPYLPPATEPDAEPLELPNLFVDGSLLVVSSGTVLPQRCVKTNQMVSDEDNVRDRLPWNGRTFQFRWSETSCDLTWFATPGVVRRTRLLKFGKTMVVPVFTATGLIPLLFEFPRALSPLLLVGFGWAFMMIVLMTPHPLKVVDYQKGRFWIRGFSEDYLRWIKENGAGSH